MRTFASPTVLLRISDGSCRMNRAFSDFSQAVRAAEAYAGAGFVVAMVSATGRFLMGFRAALARELPSEEPRHCSSNPEKTGRNRVEASKIQENPRKLSFFLGFLWMFSA